MVLGVFVTLVFAILLLHNFKMGVIWIAMTIQFLSYLGIGIGNLKIFAVLVALIVPLYIVNYKTVGREPYPKPLFIASILFVSSFLVTFFLTGRHHFPIVLSNIITYFVFPFVFWKSLRSYKDVKLAINVFYYFMSLAVLMGFLELILRHNYAFELVSSLFVLEDFSIDSTSVRYGLKRCNSFFSYFSTYGVATFIAFVVFFIKGMWIKHEKHNYMLLSIACFFAALSTGSRAIYAGLFTAMAFLLVNRKFIESKAGNLLFFGAMILFPLIFNVGFEIFDSIVNSDESKYARGSSFEMRLMQWEACTEYFFHSPWIGNGRMYIWDVVKPEHFELLGAESIWFSILVDYGIFGAFVFLFLIFACCKVLYSYNKRLVCLPIGYLFILSLSPDQGIQYNLLITVTILLIRMFQLKNGDKLNIRLI